MRFAELRAPTKDDLDLRTPGIWIRRSATLAIAGLTAAWGASDHARSVRDTLPQGDGRNRTRADRVLSTPGAPEPRVPPEDVVAACFGIPPIRSPLGVHAAAAVRHNVDSHDCVTVAPLTDKSTEALAGGAFEFRGLRIVLAWTDKP